MQLYAVNFIPLLGWT